MLFRSTEYRDIEAFPVTYQFGSVGRCPKRNHLASEVEVQQYAGTTQSPVRNLASVAEHPGRFWRDSPHQDVAMYVFEHDARRFVVALKRAASPLKSPCEARSASTILV